MELVGNVSDEKLFEAFFRAAALLFLSPYEGFGMPVIEAMAAGVPVVSAARAALPEVAGGAGLLVDPEVPELVADALLDLIADRERYRLLIDAGKRRAQEFTWDRCVERVATAIRQAV